MHIDLSTSLPAQRWLAQKKREEQMRTQYVIQLQDQTTDKLILTYKKNLISILFDEGYFNETHRIVPLEDIPPEKLDQIQSILFDITDYLIEHHPEKI